MKGAIERQNFILLMLLIINLIMGSCACVGSGNSGNVELSTEQSKEILVSIFNRNKRLYKNLEKIQAIIKGKHFRKEFNNEKGINTMVVSFPNKNKINDENLKIFFKNYAPLNDTFKVELRSPVYDSKWIYYGEWNPKTDQKHGRGIQVYADGSYYEGYWRENKTNVIGKLIHSDGDVYEGEWLDDKAHGIGNYLHNDGSRYEGQWKNDKQDGEGKETWNDGSYYEGGYKDGLKHGFGKFVWADNSFYEGQFSENCINGKGMYYWFDGRSYKGDWKNNKMHGEGTFIWPNGRNYVGSFVNDKKEGYGTHEWMDGRKYRGYWHNGKRHGDGEYYHPKQGVWKKGVWVDDIRIRQNNESTTISNQVSQISN